MVKVLVAGFNGAMGQKTVNLIQSMENAELVAAYAPNAKDDPAQYGLASSVKIFNQLDQINSDADVWIDFTVPESAFTDAKFAVEHGMAPVIGTSGMSDDQLEQLHQLSDQHHQGGIVAPNFGLSAILLMKFAKEAAEYFPDVEVIEMHHEDKKDAPSGTALNTAKLIDEVRRPDHEDNTSESLKCARGADYNGIHIHAVRLPGYVAHEQVLFGGEGEALTIRQDSFDRQSFMKGVKVAVEKVGALDHLVVGLENIL